MSKTVLLVIDAQKLITNEKLYCYNEFRSNIAGLIGEARENGVEVVYVRHDDGAGSALTKGSEGYEIYHEFSPMDDEMVFDKSVNSPFCDSGLLEYLRRNGTDSLIVTGLQTDYCIDAAVKCGFEHGFGIIVPEHCNSTFDNEFMTAEQTYHYYNDLIWNGRYARCVKMTEAIELIRGK